MYDDIATLISYEPNGCDKYGNPKVTETKTNIYVQPRGVYQAEFYNAAQLGFKPSITFDIAVRDDFNGQELIEYRGVLYDVIRVDWTAQRDKCSLICERRVKAGVTPSQESES